MKEMFAMDSEKGKVVFHDLCDLGAAVINNQIDMVEGQKQNIYTAQHRYSFSYIFYLRS